MAEFTYVGDRERTEVFGLLFVRGVPVSVTEPRVIFKLTNNRDFAQVIQGTEVLEPKRRGRPPKR